MGHVDAERSRAAVRRLALALLAVPVGLPIAETRANSLSREDLPDPFRHLCAAIAELSPSASRELADATEAQAWVSERVTRAIDRLVTARSLAQRAQPSEAHRAVREVDELFADDAAFWIGAKHQLCSCAVFGSEPPASCAALAAERWRAQCEAQPRRPIGRGIDICRLTRGR